MPKVNVIWRGEAIRDLQEAYDWYQARSNGAGEDLLIELDASLAFILQNPTGSARWRSTYRQVKLKRYPFLLVYRSVQKTIIIYSVFHTKRDPTRWGEKR